MSLIEMYVDNVMDVEIDSVADDFVSKNIVNPKEVGSKVSRVHDHEKVLFFFGKVVFLNRFFFRKCLKSSYFLFVVQLVVFDRISRVCSQLWCLTSV